ncbi:hypothetical protein FRB99_007763 [Tulasnella sp. 403]|nr:hypothetical protein FRB99_007763 [Tulasnella sp. 403]
MGRVRTSKKTGTSRPKGTHHCPECDRAFGRSTDVRRHVNAVHLKIKRFICPECGKSFAQKGGMQTHLNIQYVSTLLSMIKFSTDSLCVTVWARRPTYAASIVVMPRSAIPRAEADTSMKLMRRPVSPVPKDVLPSCSFKRKDALKSHVHDKHADKVDMYTEGQLANQMTRERFNEHYLPLAIAKAKATRRAAGEATEDDYEEAEDESSMSTHVSDSDAPTPDLSQEPTQGTRRSTRLASKPRVSMKEEDGAEEGVVPSAEASQTSVPQVRVSATPPSSAGYQSSASSRIASPMSAASSSPAVPQSPVVHAPTPGLSGHGSVHPSVHGTPLSYSGPFSPAMETNLGVPLASYFQNNAHFLNGLGLDFGNNLMHDLPMSAPLTGTSVNPFHFHHASGSGAFSTSPMVDFHHLFPTANSLPSSPAPTAHYPSPNTPAMHAPISPRFANHGSSLFSPSRTADLLGVPGDTRSYMVDMHIDHGFLEH